MLNEIKSYLIAALIIFVGLMALTIVLAVVSGHIPGAAVYVQEAQQFEEWFNR